MTMRPLILIVSLFFKVLFCFGQEGTDITKKFALTGHFNEDKILDSAFVIMTTSVTDHPNEGRNAREFVIYFSDNEFPNIYSGCCDVLLINEGDLNGDNKDEITVFQAPLNGNVYKMTTYSYVNNKWQILIEPFIVPTAGKFISEKDLQKRIFVENGSIYFMEADLNDERFELKKTKCKILVANNSN